MRWHLTYFFMLKKNVYKVICDDKNVHKFVRRDTAAAIILMKPLITSVDRRFKGFKKKKDFTVEGAR